MFSCNLGQDYEADSNSVPGELLQANGSRGWEKLAYIPFNYGKYFLYDYIKWKKLQVPKMHGGEKPYMVKKYKEKYGCAEFFSCNLITKDRNDLKFKNNTDFKIDLRVSPFKSYYNRDHRDVFIGQYNSSGQPCWWIGMDRRGKNKGKVIFNIRVDGKEYEVVSNTKIINSEWTDIRAEYSDTDNEMRLYIEEKLEASQSTGELGSFEGDNDLSIGWFDDIEQYDYCGYMDDVYISTRKSK